MMTLNTKLQLLFVLVSDVDISNGHLCQVIHRITSFPFTCPEPSESYLRSKGLCRDYRNYTCLFDENISSFSESCSVKFDFQRPGYRVTLRTNLHAGSCPVDLYQPFIFFTNESSNCEFKRSFCSEEGQIISQNGTSRTDRQCRCNYADGYTYVTKPANLCSCMPSEEDCSCYIKYCNKNQTLSPDYQCIDQFSWSGKFLCASISDLRLPDRTILDKIILQNIERKDDLGLTNTTDLLVIIIILIVMLSIFIVFISNQEVAGCFERIFHKHESKTYEISANDDCNSQISMIELQSYVPFKIDNENITEIQQDHLNSTGDSQIPMKETQSLVTFKKYKEKETEIQQDHLNMTSVDYVDTEVKIKTEIENGMESFIETDFITKLKKELASKNYILLYGKPGSGKTVSVQFIASYIQTNLEFKALHCHKPSDIFSNNNETEKRLFVFDDICGRFVFSYEMFFRWKRRVKHIESLLKTGNVKLLMTCSSAAFMTDAVRRCTLFTDNAFELSIHNWSYRDLHKVFIKTSIFPYSTINERLVFDQLPFHMITMLRQMPLFEISPYKNFPSIFYIDKVEELRNFNLSAFCSLFLCILKKGVIDESVLTSDDDHSFTAFSTNVFYAFNEYFSRRRFSDNLLFLMNIFIAKESDKFSIKQTYIFEALAVYFGKNLQKLFIRNADPEIITQHCNLQTCTNIKDNERFTIQIEKENEDVYFQRIKEQLLKGNICEVFYDRQMKSPLYRQKLADFLKQLRPDVVKQVLHSKCRMSSETTLTLAKRYQYVTFLRLFLECDNTLSLEDYPYLEIACKTNNLSFVRFLVNKNIDINKYTSDGCTALHIVCKHGFLSIIFLLVSSNADVNCTDSQGNTPLFLVCEKENEKVISHLLENGADINHSNFKGQIPLMIAARKSRKGIVDLLISKNAEVNKVDFAGMTCLMHAIKSELQNREIVITLLQAGADVNLTSNDGKTALILAIIEQHKDVVIILTSDLTGSTYIKNEETIINYPDADIINKCDNDGITPVIYACELKNDSFDVVEYLVSKGAIVNCNDNNDRTPLIIALGNGDVKLVEFLVTHGAIVNLPGYKKTTPLHEMCKSGNYNNVVLLMSKESNIDIVDKQNMTPLMLACKYGYTEITKILLQKNCQIDTVDHNGTTALMLACTGGFIDIIRFLVNHGADVNKKDKSNWTALLAYADSQYDNAEIVDFLINQGANVNSVTKDEVSSLMMASFHGHEEIVKCLINHKADVNHKDSYGKTPIFSACLSGNVDIVRVLLENRADVEVVDKNGDTLESLARKSNLTKMVDFFGKK